MTYLTMHCRACEGQNVKVDAYAEWSVEKQEWELASTFDAAICEDCGGETSIDEAEREGSPPAATEEAPAVGNIGYTSASAAPELDARS